MNEQKPYLQDIWESYYQQADGTIADPEPLLIEWVAPLSPGRAVDLGAGDGANALWLAQQGWQVTAVDYASQALNAAGERAAANGLDLRICVGDLLAFQPEQPVDLVFFGYIHLPAEQRARMLQQAAAMLSPGGTMIYVGITDMEPPIDEVPADLFAPLSEVVADLPPTLTAICSEQQKKKVSYDGSDHEHTGVLLVARRDPRG
ncbi:class I SAM-dependent methyltransferase [Acanthopleuribacter pedis]|uniref:Class I SAM-dependent methyltransferase n=1 Tax=Acanthopleuribacter pedis TaxID=442870 RepID=A0A8J7U4X4_9BACT|nr:class I SAM-dependent methyltransferase [Acanthopleuribacter pedis]MBO1321107.1 class I SAM-dependent methyltransferase [Acanthopleuribacter pedis]